MNCLRINPLANFSDKQLDEYIQMHGVFVNPLHAQGYTTIGCNRCTTPVLPGEPPRAGRWRHLGTWSAYCGINPTDLARDRPIAIDLPQDFDRPHPRPADRLCDLTRVEGAAESLPHPIELTLSHWIKSSRPQYHGGADISVCPSFRLPVLSGPVGRFAASGSSAAAAASFFRSSPDA